MNPDSERLVRKLSNAAVLARWLAGELARERHPLAHVPAELAAALLDVPVAGCKDCGAPLPVQRKGRPRLFCLACSPRKSPEKFRLVS